MICCLNPPCLSGIGQEEGAFDRAMTKTEVASMAEWRACHTP